MSVSGTKEPINKDDTGESSEQQAAIEAFLASLPFDAELIHRSIAALLGGPQEKKAHLKYLMSLEATTDDEQLKMLVNAIQLAMFGGDMSKLGEGLTGVYRTSWEIIVANAGDDEPYP